MTDAVVETDNEPNAVAGWRKGLAWCVHFYTALGLIAAAGMAVAIVDGRPEAFRWAFVLMVLAVLIDASDGTLARRVRVKEVVPGFDGRRLDDLIDFLTYTCLPLLLIWRAEVLPSEQAVWLVVPLLSSAYGFCQVSAKTDDGYFRGFPSYWNVVAFYLYLLRPPGWLALGVLGVLALLTFIPARYLYPSLGGNRLNRLTNLLGVAWAGLLLWILVRLPAAGPAGDEATRWLTLLSLFYPAYYLAASWIITVRAWGWPPICDWLTPEAPAELGEEGCGEL